MKIEDVYNTLDENKNAETELRRYLFWAAEQQKTHQDQSSQLAYDIVGLLSTKYAQTLPDDNTYIKILTLAGELELPEKLHSAATWDVLQDKIAALK